MDEHQRVKQSRNTDDLPFIQDTRASTHPATRSASPGRFEDLDNLLGALGLG
jgi:hypothetical protein